MLLDLPKGSYNYTCIDYVIIIITINNFRGYYPTYALNGGISVANNQYHRLLLRKPEGLLTMENITRLLFEAKSWHLQI